MLNILWMILIGQAAAPLLPFEAIQTMTDRFVTQAIGVYSYQDHLTYYGLDGRPNAYAMIYRALDGTPLTIIIGARRDCTPIAEYARVLPNYYLTLGRAREKAQVYAGTAVDLQRIYYAGPGEEYYSFRAGDRELMVNTYSLQVYEQSFFTRAKPEPDPALEKILNAKWDRYLSGLPSEGRYTGYVDSVPYVIWSYGCTPTASAMIAWYWDSRGYSRLVDHFFDRWDNVEQGNDYNRPNVHREFSIAMNTDSMSTGGTNIYNVAPGHNTVFNSQHGYSFTNSMSPQGTSANQYIFSWVKTEIDGQRPVHWCVLQYWYSGQFIGHSTTAVGYDIILPDTFIVLHNTWDYSEHSWDLWTYYGGTYSRDYAYPTVPAGAAAVDLDLTFPSDANTWFFRTLKYKFQWTSQGAIDHIKLWRAPGVLWLSNDTTYWQVLNASVPNTGSYIYTVPDESLYHRINLVGLNASNTRIAADGSFAPFATKPIINNNPLIHLYGHRPLASIAQDVVVVGNYAYLAMNSGDLAVVNVADSSLPELANLVAIGGTPKSLAYANGYLYCATGSDMGFKVISLANPTAPVVIGSVTLAAATNGITVRGNYAYVTAGAAGLRIVSVVNPTAPAEVGYYNTPGQGYDVCLVNDTIACVADGTRDLIFIDVSNPAAPESLTSMRTPGIPKGVYFNGYLFVGDGPGGVGIVNVSNPAQPDSIFWIDTPGTPYKCLRQGSLLTVCDGGSGIHFYNIANPAAPVDLGYLDSYGNANNCVQSGNQIILADGDDGLYILGAPVGIEEGSSKPTPKSRLLLSANPFRHQLNLSLIGLVGHEVRLRLFDITGTCVKTLINGIAVYPAVSWDGKNDAGQVLPAGVYFLELQTADTSETHKLIMIR